MPSFAPWLAHVLRRYVQEAPHCHGCSLHPKFPQLLPVLHSWASEIGDRSFDNRRDRGCESDFVGCMNVDYDEGSESGVEEIEISRAVRRQRSVNVREIESRRPCKKHGL